MRAIRSAYLQRIEARPILQLMPLSAAAFGVLSASKKRSGRSVRPRYNYLWIAAQAIEHEFALGSTMRLALKEIAVSRRLQ